MSLLANVQAAQIEWANKLNIAGQGEVKKITLMQRQDGTNLFIPLLEVESFDRSESDPAGRSLPPHVSFELTVAEGLITEEHADKTVAIDHGKQRYAIVRGSGAEAGVWAPTDAVRKWRFWVIPLEKLP
jgi:hypothetical protein